MCLNWCNSSLEKPVLDFQNQSYKKNQEFRNQKCNFRLSNFFVSSIWFDCRTQSNSIRVRYRSVKYSSIGYEWLCRENLDRTRSLRCLMRNGARRRWVRWGDQIFTVEYFVSAKLAGQIINNKASQVSGKPSESLFGCVRVKKRQWWNAAQLWTKKNMFLKWSLMIIYILSGSFL